MVVFGGNSTGIFNCTCLTPLILPYFITLLLCRKKCPVLTSVCVCACACVCVRVCVCGGRSAGAADIVFLRGGESLHASQGHVCLQQTAHLPGDTPDTGNTSLAALQAVVKVW